MSRRIVCYRTDFLKYSKLNRIYVTEDSPIEYLTTSFSFQGHDTRNNLLEQSKSTSFHFFDFVYYMISWRKEMFSQSLYRNIKEFLRKRNNSTTCVKYRHNYFLLHSFLAIFPTCTNTPPRGGFQHLRHDSQHSFERPIVAAHADLST